MPINIECPKCQALLAAPDHAAGKQVRCKACNAVMLVPMLDPPEESDLDIIDDTPTPVPPPPPPPPVMVQAPAPVMSAFDFDAPEEKPRKKKKKAIVEDDDEEPAPPAPVPAPVLPAPAVPTPSAFEFDINDDKPRKSKKKAVVEDDEEVETPVPKKKSSLKLVEDEEEEEVAQTKAKSKRNLDEDEDGDDRPAKKTKDEPKSKLPLFIGLGVGAFVLLIVGGVGLYLIFGKSKTTEASKTPSSKTTKASDTGKSTTPTTASVPKTGGAMPEGWVAFDQPDFTCWLKQSGGPPQSGTKANVNSERPEFNLAKFNSSNRSLMVTIIPLQQSMDVSRAKVFMDQEVERRILLQIDGAKIDKRKEVMLDKQLAQEWVVTTSGSESGTFIYRFFLDRNRIFIVSAGGNAIIESDNYITDFFRSFKLKN